MHKRLIEEGFNRRYVLLPLLLSIGLVVTGFVITEMRREHTRSLIETVRERQETMRVLAETIYQAMEAESAQRGFLLTGEQKYLPPLETGLAGAEARLSDLIVRYEKLAPAELPVLRQARTDLQQKAAEMRGSVTLLREGKSGAALALVKSDVGLQLMKAFQQSLEALRTRERDRIFAGLNEWNESARQNTMINLSAMLFTITVLIVLGLLATRDIRRREGFAGQLAEQIEIRTAELRGLSQHMSRVAEAEKHALARELHDELGGLLVAMRMDVAQLRKRTAPAPDLDARWARVEKALADGVELKSRVIEALRPTLLDNMGLFTALRWLLSQHGEQSGIAIRTEGLDEDIALPPETAIAVFRTVQEALTNVIKHAAAKRIVLTAEAGDTLTLQISDDGRGLPPGSEQRTGSHGLKQMRFRMEAVGGTLRFESNDLGGTTVVLSVPIRKDEA
jgi:signal transduction histidine kinase